MSDESSGGWHLDRRIPIALILAIMVNFGGLVWVAAQIDARVLANEKAIARIEAMTNELPEKIATMKQQITNIERSVNRIERSLERREKD